MNNRIYQRCTRCVMDTTDSKISFDDKLLSPKSSTILALNSNKYPMAVILNIIL